MDYVKAFVVGGIICAIVQILMEKTKLMPGRIMVMLVCTGALLGAVGIYGPFSKWAGAGANVPLLGFGNVLWKGVKEVLSGVVFFAAYAPVTIGNKMIDALIYSVTYNGSYLAVEEIITIIVISIPPVKKALDYVKQMANSR